MRVTPDELLGNETQEKPTPQTLLDKDMASCSLSCEDQILCSICLDVFKEPVSTPCGHNYCRACITGCWDTSNQTRCPLCNRRFRHRPELKCNTSFRDMVEHLKSMSLTSPREELQAKPGEVACDICLDPKLKALKTCLVCLASYCQLHLEPHQRVSNLKKHKLTEPVPNLDDRVCKKHDKMFDFFCTVDKKCVCYLCLKDDHAAHKSVPLQRAFSQEKASIEREIAELKMMENAKSRDMNQLRSSLEQSKKNKDTDIAGIDKVFTALVESLQKHKAKLVELTEQKHNEAVEQPEDRVLQLEQEITELRLERSELEQLIKTEDHLQFLLCNPAVHRPSHNPGRLSWPSCSVLSRTEYDPADDERFVDTVKTAVDLMEKMLSNEMARLIQKVQCPAEEDGNTTWIPPNDKLMMIQQNDSVDVTLDPYSAQACLSVSQEGKALRNNPFINEQVQSELFSRRFKNQPFAVSVDGFSSGRFYYEVQVSGAGEWVLGVVKENINRYMPCGCLPRTTDGAWIIAKLNHWWDAGGCYFVPPGQRLRKVGVFVDYEKGEVSFYDVNARSVIFSYTGCTFKEPVPPLKSSLYGLVGASVSNRTKLYPVFGVFSDPDHLKISPVAVTF